MKDRIEILDMDFFDTLKDEMAVVERVQSVLDQNVGWHYYLDFAWLLSCVRDLPRGSLILDAGAGWGLMQFILIELGYNVISADFADREVRPKHRDRYGKDIFRINSELRRFVNRYTIHLKRINPSYTGFEMLKSAISNTLTILTRFSENQEKALQVIERERLRVPDADSVTSDPLAGRLAEEVHGGFGRLFIYKCDVMDMELLPDDFVDAVVSVSALEHNEHKDIKKCVAELERVTKPGGRLAITVSASNGEDEFHEPSKGWCFGEPSLRSLFGLNENTWSNFHQKDELFEKLKKHDNELHKRLSPTYFKIGTSGMPWGVWDPKYQPVGILKFKP